MPPTDVQIKERNLFKIQINTKNQLLIEDQVRNNLDGLIDEIKEFVLNPSGRHDLAEKPDKAIISLKTNRGTQYEHFINVLDEVKESYYQMYGSKAGLSSDEFRKLDRNDPKQNRIYLTIRRELPMNISIAEPDKIN